MMGSLLAPINLTRRTYIKVPWTLTIEVLGVRRKRMSYSPGKALNNEEVVLPKSYHPKDSCHVRSWCLAWCALSHYLGGYTVLLWWGKAKSMTVQLPPHPPFYIHSPDEGNGGKVLRGWECPRCHSVNAPSIKRCSCKPEKPRNVPLDEGLIGTSGSFKGAPR